MIKKIDETSPMITLYSNRIDTLSRDTLDPK